LAEYIAGCTFVENNRTFTEGEPVKGISEDRLKVLKNLPGWDGKKMVYSGKAVSQSPKNKMVTPEENKKSLIEEKGCQYC
jgi:hypothetical protein